MDSQMMSLPLYCVFSLFNTCLEVPNIFLWFRFENFAIILLKITIELLNISLYYRRCYIRDVRDGDTPII
jgi:hypothetical protein